MNIFTNTTKARSTKEHVGQHVLGRLKPAGHSRRVDFVLVIPLEVLSLAGAGLAPLKIYAEAWPQLPLKQHSRHPAQETLLRVLCSTLSVQ
jgi:hypothetical protein